MSRRSQKVETGKYAASAGNIRLPHFRNSRKNGYKLWVQRQALVMIGRWHPRQPLTSHK